MPGNCQSHSDGMSAGCNQWRQLSYWKGFFCPQHIRCKMLIVSAMQPVTLTILLKQEQMRHGPRDKNTWARVTGQEEKCCLIHLLPLSNPSWGSLDMPIAHLPNSTLFMNFPQKSIFSNWKVLTLLRPSRPSSFSPPFPDTELAPARRALLRSQTFKTCSVQCGFLTIWGAPFHRNSRQEKKTD